MRLTEKWEKLLGEAEGIPAITSASKADIVARIFENQERDIQSDPAYRDRELLRAFGHDGNNLNEAVVGGDHGYNVSNIASGQTTGAVTNIGPTVMGMVRRAIPNLIAFDVCGVQPMNGPASQYFALRAVYGSDPLASGGREAFHPYKQPNASFSGQTGVADVPTTTWVVGTAYKASLVARSGEIRYFIALATAPDTVLTTIGQLTDAEYTRELKAGTLVEVDAGMATSQAELQEGFNGSSGNAWQEMGFRIDKQVVEAKSRQLKSQYSIELAQDLKAVHGMDADAELSSILANEIMVEINREIVNLINAQAQIGATGWTATSSPGTFNFNDATDVKGARWAGEAYKALLIQIEKEANEIARQTGRGAGNFIIASRNVVSALSMTEVFVSFAAQGLQNGSMVTDTNKAVYAGTLGGRFKVYVDQYAVTDYITVGYKGSTEMDAGVYYCPYVALTPLRGADARNFQPVMGFKTRYGVGVNPFADPTLSTSGAGKLSSGMPGASTFGKNCYFRKFFIAGL